MTELTLEQSLKQILPTLPLPIQKFFEQHKLGEIARLLMERYALHVDHGAILERELMFLLLGLENPDEFAEALYAELPISKQTVRDIIADVNQEVFVPLREQMRSVGGGSASGGKVENAQPIKSAPLPVQKPTPTPIPPPIPKPISIPAPKVVPVPAQTFAPGQKYSPPSHFHLQNKIPPLPSFPAPSTQPPASRLLEDHEEPSPSLKATEGTAHIELKPPSPPQKPPLPPSIKSYSSDPYREPIDEK